MNLNNQLKERALKTICEMQSCLNTIKKYLNDTENNGDKLGEIYTKMSDEYDYFVDVMADMGINYGE